MRSSICQGVVIAALVTVASACSSDSTGSIGHGRYNRGNTDYFSGSLSSLGLIGRVITADEVAALYALGPG